MMDNTRHCDKCKCTNITGYKEGKDILFWYCVKCGYAFHRFNEGTPGYEKADPIIKRINR